MFRYPKHSLRYGSLKWNNYIHVEKKLRRKITSNICLLFSCCELAAAHASFFSYFPKLVMVFFTTFYNYFAGVNKLIN